MDSVGIKELKRDTSAIIRKVREDRESVEITYRGKVVAKIVPTESAEDRRRKIEEVWSEMDKLTQDISRKWTGTPSAVDAVREQRRDT